MGRRRHARRRLRDAHGRRRRVAQPVTDPSTPGEWAEALTAAVFCIGMAAAESYGLVTDPDVDVARCESVIAAGRELGHRIPTLDEAIARTLEH